jgi:hypothetical protein
MAILYSATVIVIGLWMSADVALQPQIDRPHGALVVDINGTGHRLTSIGEGVEFDLNADRILDRVSWIPRGSDLAFLVADWNQNGRIDSGFELIGVGSGPSDGFKELAANDGIAPGADSQRIADRTPDGVIDARDLLYQQMRLWKDLNHNGISEEDELESLPHAGVIAIELNEMPLDIPDVHGNLLRSELRIVVQKGAGSTSTRTMAKVQLQVRR